MINSLCVYFFISSNTNAINKSIEYSCICDVNKTANNRQNNALQNSSLKTQFPVTRRQIDYNTNIEVKKKYMSKKSHV